MLSKIVTVPYFLIGGFSLFLFVIFIFFFLLSGGKGIEGLGLSSPAKALLGISIYGGIGALCGATVVGILRKKTWGYVAGLIANVVWIGLILFIFFKTPSFLVITGPTIIIPIVTTPFFLARLPKRRAKVYKTGSPRNNE